MPDETPRRPLAISAAKIFDGESWHENAALLVENGGISGIVRGQDLPGDAERIEAAGDMLVPGFIDLQVNGGGGVQFNTATDRDSIAAIAAAHRRFGTTAFLPTLITDTPQVTERAIRAAIGAATNVPGCLGLHLEGPHLAPARKGAHAAELIRPMSEADAEQLIDAARRLPLLLVTLAPEIVPSETIRRLVDAGVVVSLGHSDADHATALAATVAGARLVTHLFNAMSPLGHRAPGLAGAALATGALSAGIIVDGLHVADPVIGIAARGKAGPGRLFVVTDAMAPLGTDASSFTLNGREIAREPMGEGLGRLTLADGTLAGADIDMSASLRRLAGPIGLPLELALRMVSLHAAEAAGLAERKGRLLPGFDADFVELDAGLRVRATWIAGSRLYSA